MPENTVAALQWTALASDDTTTDAARAIWDHGMVPDFQEGMRSYVSPMQSMVVADTEGNIGLIAPGRIPMRSAENPIMGRAPAPGWLAEFDWQGFIPFEELPRKTNPGMGAIGTANTKIVDKTYPHFLTFDWEETYRQERIDALVIHAAELHSPAVSRAVQADAYSAALVSLKDRMLQAVDGNPDVDASAIDLLAEWNGDMTRKEIAPLVFMAWLRESIRAVFSDELGPAFRNWFKPRVKVMEGVLGGTTVRDWCDNSGTPDTEDCGAVLAGALADAVRDLEARFGDNRDGWRWGAAHRAHNLHRPFGSISLLAGFFNIEIESDGGNFTLNRGAMTFTKEDNPFANTHASSLRAIYDFADLDRSTYIQTTGQSGNIFSPHYGDFAARWANVEGVEIPADPAAYADKIEGRWELRPG